ncbi:unnamed protein product [Rangifer tarandus platyrhynchus]|uniref:Uncharacterized protein n=2 Tax=Rangifer tarandus platyrhynchus TaxID=3082113 RepID=A0ACB0ET96_RANTA|nr:unnamed protein product [Rangifer tarandus platyrhynchus]CAI9703925.1 unnamed protein product [Rangifer tarandus platyrhynchus]
MWNCECQESGDGSRPARARPPLRLPHACGLARREEGLLCPRVWKDMVLVARQQRERPAVFKQLELGGSARVVCPGFSKAGGKEKKKNLPSLSGHWKGGEGPPPQVGTKLPAAQTTSRLRDGCQPGRLPRPLAARPAQPHLPGPPLALTAPLWKGCWDQPVSC